MSWSFIAMRAMQMKKKNGSYVMVQPGAEVSDKLGFAEMPNPGLWVKRGYFKLTDPNSVATRGTYVPPRAATPADMAAKEKRRALLDKGIELPKSDFDKAGEHNIGPGKDQPSAAIDFGVEPVVPQVEEQVTESTETSEEELTALPINDLRALAVELGVKHSPKAGKKIIARTILAATNAKA